MRWRSLGLGLETSALPDDAESTLRSRWETAAFGSPAVEVRVQTGPVPPRPPGAPREITVSNGHLSVWCAADEVWLGDHLHLSVGPDGDDARLTAVEGEDAPEVAWLLAIVELQRLAGWVPLHAAAVARQGRAVAITGVSGAGKSTAALRLAGEGWTVLAEDQTWVHPATGQVTGLDRFLRTYADSLDRFAPHLRAQVQGQDAYGKLMVPLRPPQEAAHLGALLVFGLPDHPETAERVRAVWECSGVPLLDSARRISAQGLSRLMRELKIRGTGRETVLAQVEDMTGTGWVATFESGAR